MGWKSAVAFAILWTAIALPTQAAETTTFISRHLASGLEVMAVDDGKTVEFRTGGPAHMLTILLVDVNGDGKITPYVDTYYAAGNGRGCTSYQLGGPLGATSFCGTLKTGGTFTEETAGSVRITHWKIPYAELTQNGRTVSYTLDFWDNNAKRRDKGSVGVYRLASPFKSAINPQYEAQISLCQTRDKQRRAEALAACAAVIGTGLASPAELAILLRVRGVLKAEGKDYAGALADFEKSLAAAPTSDQRGTTQYSRSVVYALMGRPADQAAELDRALTTYPGVFAARLARGDLRNERGLHKEALADYEEARRVLSNHLQLRNALCWTRAAHLNIELDKARGDCDYAVRWGPNEGAYRDSRGMVALREGAWQAAFEDYTAAIGLNPDSASSLFGRAIAAARLGMTDRGAADLARARALSKTVEADYAKRGLKP